MVILVRSLKDMMTIKNCISYSERNFCHHHSLIIQKKITIKDIVTVSFSCFFLLIMDIILIYVTHKDKNNAQKVTDHLFNLRLIACVT